MKYVHTNIITGDWKRLAAFYEQVFGCMQVPPVRDQQGEWLDRGVGLHNARLRGAHLRLPGWGPNGPTLEIYQYDSVEDQPAPVSNGTGYRHLAFAVDDVGTVHDAVLAHGGSAVGEISHHEVEGLGSFTFVYVADPDGNIIELQHWD